MTPMGLYRNGRFYVNKSFVFPLHAFLFDKSVPAQRRGNVQVAKRQPYVYLAPELDAKASAS